MKTDFRYKHSRVEQQAPRSPDIGWRYSGSALLGLLRPKRALLVLRLRSIAARRASTCWACLLCGPCAFPPTAPDVAKCVGIVRLPEAVDIVLPASLPVSPESLRYCSYLTPARPPLKVILRLPGLVIRSAAYGTPSSCRLPQTSRLVYQVTP